ncbi:NUDIX hydrolase [Solitalea koreensis]|uniref:NUDIX domain-containing protein n=1 Tax=Solitalea koreensis TaxID=543615 RepID=A0A521CYI0_9SPHI|nr:CoA pyrophosphatase [Solitalea koreensis]SMO64468.1 NUDIX domain-containing protein [Solitalea koreensis]
MTFTHLIHKLETRLQQPLPGKNAHLQMIPQLRLPDYDKGYDLSDARKSGVLILLYPHLNEIYIPFIQRPVYSGIHSGQIGLPGGKMEPEDRSLIQTALREAKEEIGIDPSRTTILGELSDVYIPPSKFLVKVVLAYVNHRPSFTLYVKEVNELLEIKLTELLDDTIISERSIINSQELQFNAPCYILNDKVIWGATAMMLSELRWILREIATI